MGEQAEWRLTECPGRGTLSGAAGAGRSWWSRTREGSGSQPLGAYGVQYSKGRLRIVAHQLELHNETKS